MGLQIDKFVSNAHKNCQQTACALSSAWPKLSGAETEKHKWHEWHYSSFWCDGTTQVWLSSSGFTKRGDLGLNFGAGLSWASSGTRWHFGMMAAAAFKPRLRLWRKLRWHEPRELSLHAVLLTAWFSLFHSHPHPRKQDGLGWAQLDEKNLRVKHILLSFQTTCSKRDVRTERRFKMHWALLAVVCTVSSTCSTVVILYIHEDVTGEKKVDRIKQ